MTFRRMARIGLAVLSLSREKLVGAAMLRMDGETGQFVTASERREPK